jgi:hypothetical protein
MRARAARTSFFKFENRKEPLLSRRAFLFRVARGVARAGLLAAFALGLGMVGYHHYETMSWVDAFVNASMILSGMGPVGTLQTDAGKIFAGCYALFSGLVFITIVATVLAPLLHRFLHQFHIDKS